MLFYRDSARLESERQYYVLLPPNLIICKPVRQAFQPRIGRGSDSPQHTAFNDAHTSRGAISFYNEERRPLLYSCKKIYMSDVLPAYRIEILRRRHTLVLFEHTAEMLRIVKPQIIRGCLITFVKSQVGVFLLSQRPRIRQPQITKTAARVCTSRGGFYA